MSQKDFDKGYNDAIEAIKQHIANGGGDGSGQGSGQGGSDDLPMPSNQGDPSNGGQSSKSNSRTDSSNSNQGIVRPEDCIGGQAGELAGTPGTAGGMIDRSVGDKIAKSEGYEDEGPGETATENDWKDSALKAAAKMGNTAGNLKSKIEGLYKTSTDWKKALQKIVGYSISPEDKRQAYANKNVLIAQNRISRTDKDKYDNVDYIMAWIDSSGSMSDEQLRMCLSEVYRVALQKKPLKLVVIQCDTRIQDIEEYTNLKDLQRQMSHATVKGRGGTDLKPCWDLLKNDKKYKNRPSELVMIFTDGFLEQYKRDPKTMRNLCWCIIDNPSFDLTHKDAHTKVIYLNSKDIK